MTVSTATALSETHLWQGREMKFLLHLLTIADCHNENTDNLPQKRQLFCQTLHDYRVKTFLCGGYTGWGALAGVFSFSRGLWFEVSCGGGGGGGGDVVRCLSSW